VKIKRGHLYVADLSPRQGTEPGKQRPVLVIQNDLLNETSHPSTWVLPCTTRLTPPNILRVRLPKGCGGADKECDVMVDQSRSIDNQRLKKHSGELPKPIFDEVIEKLKMVGGL
jgi:mRNA interferase MazF